MIEDLTHQRRQQKLRIEAGSFSTELRTAPGCLAAREGRMPDSPEPSVKAL